MDRWVLRCWGWGLLPFGKNEKILALGRRRHCIARSLRCVTQLHGAEAVFDAHSTVSSFSSLRGFPPAITSILTPRYVVLEMFWVCFRVPGMYRCITPFCVSMTTGSPDGVNSELNRGAPLLSRNPSMCFVYELQPSGVKSSFAAVKPARSPWAKFNVRMTAFWTKCMVAVAVAFLG